MDLYPSVIRFFQEGGPFMYLIMAVFALGVAIALERYIYLTVARGRNRSVWNKVLPLIQKGEFAKVIDLANKSRTPMGNILGFGLSGMGANRRAADIELAMEEGLMEIVPRLEKRTPYLATLANIATLLGLLGTILGLIDAFSAVSNADPAEKANLLSSSISVAMNTTAFGLMAAIPLLLIHSVLQTKTTEIVDSLEMASVKVLNLLRNQSAPPPAGRPVAAEARA